MTASTYPEAIRRVLLSEGGYVNHPSDPGGETNYGITIKVARANGYQGSMRDLPVDEARRIYRFQYANPVHFDDDPRGLDYTLFDYAVNSGVSRANRVIRRVCSIPDNAPWPTLSLALSKRDPKDIIASVNAERLKFLQGLKTWPVFGKGWGSRVESVNSVSLQMATVGAPLPSTLPPAASSEGKGEVPKPNTSGPVIAGGGATAGGGAVTWGGWVAAHPIATFAIAAAAIIAAIVIAEMIARKWQARKQDAPTPGLIPVPERV